MINLQKRYIYAVIPAIIIFILLYLVLDFYLWLSLLFAIPSYVAGVFLFKSKDLRDYDPKALARYQYELSRLNAYIDKKERYFLIMVLKIFLVLIQIIIKVIILMK